MTVADRVKKEAEEARDLARRSPLFWFSTHARIPNKEKKLIRPKPNIFQIRMGMAYEWCVEQGITALIIGLKPRQVGGTTIASAIGYHHMRRVPCDGVAIGDILDRSHKLFQMYQRYREHDRLDWGQVDQPGTNDLLYLGHSKLEKKTAENPTASRAATLQYIHKSEVAYWPQGGARDAEETDTALMGSLAKHKDSLSIDESTPKGAFGLFAKKWMAAQWPKYDRYWMKYAQRQVDGESMIIRVFAAWYEFEEYARNVTAAEAEHIMATLTKREKSGIQHYKWTVEQLAWRRYTIINDCGNSETKFDEEYPEDPVSCFSASGSPRFNLAGLDYLQKLAEATPFKTGTLSNIDPTSGARPSFTPTVPTNAWLKLWELPKVGCRYFIGSDIAEDKDMNPTKLSLEVKRDAHAPFVIRAGFLDDRGTRWRPRIVGRFIKPCRWGHELFVERIFLTSAFFGMCPIAPEMNNHGLAVARALKSIKIGDDEDAICANLYNQTLIDPLDQSEKKVYGHRTTPANRPELIENLANAIEKAVPKVDELTGETIMDPDALELLDVDAIAECRTFIINKEGRAEGAPGSHDDDVMGVAITYFLVGSATTYTEPIVERVIPEWDYRRERGAQKRRSITGS